MRYSGKAMMSLAAIIIPAYAVLAALKWPFKTALFPLAIGIPVIIMGIVDLFLVSSGKESQRAQMPVANIPAGEKLDPTIEIRRTVSIVLWIFLFFLILVLLGFSIAVPLSVFLYLKIKSKERWPISVVLSVLAGLVFYALFILFADIQFPEGLITGYIYG